MNIWSFFQFVPNFSLKTILIWLCFKMLKLRYKIKILKYALFLYFSMLISRYLVTITLDKKLVFKFYIPIHNILEVTNKLNILAFDIPFTLIHFPVSILLQKTNKSNVSKYQKSNKILKINKNGSVSYFCCWVWLRNLILHEDNINLCTFRHWKNTSVFSSRRRSTCLCQIYL